MHRELKVRTAQKKTSKKVPNKLYFLWGGKGCWLNYCLKKRLRFSVSETSSSFELSLWESFVGHHHSMPFQFLSLLIGRTHYHVTCITAYKLNNGCPMPNTVSASENCISACHEIFFSTLSFKNCQISVAVFIYKCRDAFLEVI